MGDVALIKTYLSMKFSNLIGLIFLLLDSLMGIYLREWCALLEMFHNFNLHDLDDQIL